MTDILVQLTRASWRGVEFPIMSREFGFAHEQEIHRNLFADAQLVESIGRQNPTYRYTIPFREDIARNPWKNLFTQVYPKFLEACLDRSNGPLIDPVHGPVQAKCVTVTERVDVNKRDGIDLDVEFIASPDLADELDVATNLENIEIAVSLQGALDRDTIALSDETKKQLAEFNKGSEKGRLNPLDFGTSVLNQIEANGNKIDAAFGDVAFRAEKLDDSLGRMRKPSTQPMRRNARRLALAARDIALTAFQGESSKSRPISVYTVPATIGKIALAGKLGNSVQELMKLNPTLARMTEVPTGTQIAYYRSG